MLNTVILKVNSSCVFDAQVSSSCVHGTRLTRECQARNLAAADRSGTSDPVGLILLPVEDRQEEVD